MEMKDILSDGRASELTDLDLLAHPISAFGRNALKVELILEPGLV